MVGLFFISFVYPALPKPVEAKFDMSTAKLSFPRGFGINVELKREPVNLLPELTLRYDPRTKLYYRLSDIQKMENTQILIRAASIAGLMLLLIAWIITNWQKIRSRIKTSRINYPLFFISLALFIPALNIFSLEIDLPYGYYQLLRFAVCGFGGYVAYLAHQQNKKRWVWALGIIALIFNPFYKFHFDKELWQLFDLIVGIVFVIASFKIKKNYVPSQAAP